MIVSKHETRNLDDRGRVNLIYFHQGQVLLISATAVGFYRDEMAITDPLGNGVIGYEKIPEALAPQWQEDRGYIEEQRAGYVGLTSGAVLFIRPDGIGLYDNGDAALRNRGVHWIIPFSVA